ncbi:MAG: deoxynucleoside kinase [Pseudomonadota bacterium]|nr:deoxynucleoside kinase [Pseudomonadota bacterium]
MREEIQHRYIAIEGPIGVGKTTLARRLADTLQAELLLENAEENPFLKRFYQDAKAGALSAQLFFLMQRAQQVADLRQQDMFASYRVADFMLEKDALFAEVTLDPDEFALYRRVYELLAPEAMQPDLVVYLQAPVEVLLRRVMKRGIGYERTITRDYLARLNDAYTRLFHQYTASPLLIVNAAEINLVDGDEEYRLLMEQIAGIRSGRHYFNPGPALL